MKLFITKDFIIKTTPFYFYPFLRKLLPESYFASGKIANTTFAPFIILGFTKKATAQLRNWEVQALEQDICAYRHVIEKDDSGIVLRLLHGAPHDAVRRPAWDQGSGLTCDQLAGQFREFDAHKAS